MLTSISTKHELKLTIDCTEDEKSWIRSSFKLNFRPCEMVFNFDGFLFEIKLCLSEKRLEILSGVREIKSSSKRGEKVEIL